MDDYDRSQARSELAEEAREYGGVAVTLLGTSQTKKVGQMRSRLRSGVVSKKDDVIQAFDDGRICQDVASWTEQKHGLTSLYAKLFSAGMKNKWDTLVYVELYAGAGYSKIRDTSKIVPGSLIRALTLDCPFDKYVFCEKNPELLDALKVRVQRHAPAADVEYVPGDCNERITDVLSAIPRGSTQNKVLTLCFVDPPDIGIKFETVRRLSDRFMDFLVLLALYMDANRNEDNYVKEKSVKVDVFLGSSDWRERWRMAQQNGVPFPRFLAEEFSNSMEALGYQPQPIYKMKEVKLSEQNLPLYRLALFSRHPRAYSFWDQVLSTAHLRQCSILRNRLANNSKIEWTDATWNPVRGCTKISPGCKHCYAETFAERFRGVKGHPYEQGFDLRLVPEKLTEPLAWRSPKLVFVNSMSDLFQDGVPDEYIEAVCQVMVTANWHTFQVLTKRSERLRKLLSGRLQFAAGQAHIWWGVSVEDRKYGLPRVDHLREAPAKTRFLSIEPLLENLGEIDLSGISWVIVGGESGPGARPMKKEWVISIREQCKAYSVPFFFKQWGGVRKVRNGRELDGRTYDEYPPRVTAPVPDRTVCAGFAETIFNSFRGIIEEKSLVQVTA